MKMFMFGAITMLILITTTVWANHTFDHMNEQFQQFNAQQQQEQQKLQLDRIEAEQRRNRPC